MSVRDGTDRRVSFNTSKELRDKIDKLTVIMSKLAAKDSHERKPFKPQIYKSSRTEQSLWSRKVTKPGQIMEIEDILPRLIIEVQRNCYGRQNNRENYRNESIVVTIEIG